MTQANVESIVFEDAVYLCDHSLSISLVSITANDGIEAGFVYDHVEHVVFEGHIANVHMLEDKFRVLLPIEILLKLDRCETKVDRCHFTETLVP